MLLLQARLLIVAVWTAGVGLVSGHAARVSGFLPSLVFGSLMMRMLQRGEPNRDFGGGLNDTGINNATNSSDPTAPPISFSSGFINASSFPPSAVSSASASDVVVTSTLPSASASESDPTATVIGVSSDTTSTNNGTVTAIAASVGASIAASLIVLGGVLFCMRTRFSASNTFKSKPRSTFTQLPGETETETTALAWRLTSLETEATALRERVARLEARGRRSREGAVIYLNEKDDGMGVRRGKDCPPTYVD
ncbi:hypothetical protein R3P38DRAFT_330127 [Favolaschia claudopus]|uniref:Transmembrane protein n=1 Tax=Favolaschia claudopus TaxID=2862362 RepID=A0AAV9ZM31_9AGAR